MLLPYDGGGGQGMRLQGTKSHTQTTHYGVCLIPRSSCTCEKEVASFPNLPRFILRFAFSVYVNTQKQKKRESATKKWERPGLNQCCCQLLA